MQHDWKCSRCVGHDGKPWRNRGWRDACAKCKVHKGKCFGGKADSPPGTSPTVSSRRTVDVKDKAKDKAKDRAKPAGDKRLGALEAEIAQLKAAAEKREATIAALQDGRMAVDDGLGEVDGSDAKERIKLCRGVLADIDKFGPDKAAFFAEARERTAQELQALLLCQRESKPLDQRAKDLERALESARRQHAKAKEKTEGLQAELRLLQESVAAAGAAEQEALDKLTKLESEQADVLRRRADEVEKTPAPATAPVAGGGAEGAALRALLAVLGALKADNQLVGDLAAQFELAQAAVAPPATPPLLPPAAGTEHPQQPQPQPAVPCSGWAGLLQAESDEAAVRLVLAARKKERPGPYSGASGASRA